MLFLKTILSVPCTMDSSFFSQRPNFPHQRLWHLLPKKKWMIKKLRSTMYLHRMCIYGGSQKSAKRLWDILWPWKKTKIAVIRSLEVKRDFLSPLKSAKYNCKNHILFSKLFYPTLRKKCYSDREKTFENRGWRLRICKNFKITKGCFFQKVWCIFLVA